MFKLISATSGRIVTKFYLKHHWDGGKAAIGFRPDRIRTLVSMATDSSHRDIMGKCCEHSSAFILSSCPILLKCSPLHNYQRLHVLWENRDRMVSIVRVMPLCNFNCNLFTIVLIVHTL